MECLQNERIKTLKDVEEMNWIKILYFVDLEALAQL